MGAIYLSVDRDDLTGGLQISINEEGAGGFRPAGRRNLGEQLRAEYIAAIAAAPNN